MMPFRCYTRIVHRTLFFLGWILKTYEAGNYKPGFLTLLCFRVPTRFSKAAPQSALHVVGRGPVQLLLCHCWPFHLPQQVPGETVWCQRFLCKPSHWWENCTSSELNWPEPASAKWAEHLWTGRQGVWNHSSKQWALVNLGNKPARPLWYEKGDWQGDQNKGCRRRGRCRWASSMLL